SRIRGKRAAPEEPEDWDLEDPNNREPSQPSNLRRVGRLPGLDCEALDHRDLLQLDATPSAGNMTSNGEGSKAHEGPPSWDGDASTFQEYEESSLLWEQSVAYEKRYLCGPKLAAALKGAAKRLVAGKTPSWLSHNKGVTTLMQHLRTALGKPQVSDLTEHLSKFFKGSRRRNNEDINSYIARKSEIYLRACQALQRVNPLQTQRTPGSQEGSTTSWTPTWNSSRRSSYDHGQAEEDADDAGDAGVTASTTATEETSRNAWNSYQWNYGYYSWNNPWWSSSWGRYGTWDNESWEKPVPEDMRTDLAMLGEAAPMGWTKVELGQRLRELREQGIADSEAPTALTSMEKMLKDLRKASKLKSTLTTFCTQVLHLELTGNEVMSKMIDKATKEIHRVCPPESHDYVGFGKHADERYVTIATQYHEYANWVKVTFRENGEEHVDPRLARLAKWLIDQEQKPEPKVKAAVRKDKGYMKMRVPDDRNHSPGRHSGSRSSTDPTPAQTMRMMTQMAEALESVRQELAEVKGERPRKTAGRAEEGSVTDSSFSVLSGSPQKDLDL
ncbi:unnamed protein product, partial [Symbiodinium necroappetens]